MKLVSVVIVTYNSGQYVIDTLESAKNQTYKNLELIISDDCSRDDTLKVCERWINNNKERFVSTKIITVNTNTGVSANCNRGIKNTSSDWIKFMAGDDILLPNCIEDNMNYVSDHKEAKILFSYLYNFNGSFNLAKSWNKHPETFPKNLMDISFNVIDQYQKLLLSDRITYTPSYFFNKKAILSVGGYDEKLRMLEDYPMWLKLTKAGIRLHFMEKVTVAYRQHENALNNMVNFGLFKPQYKNLEKIKIVHVYPNLPWDIVGNMKFTYTVNRIFDSLFLNKNTKFHKIIYNLFNIYLNPFQYILAFKRKVLNAGEKNAFYA